MTGTVSSLLAAEGGYQVFDLRGGEWAILLFSGAAALLAIAVGFSLMRGVLANDQGTPKMIEIATAIQEGALAYLKRQFRTIGVILVPLAIVVFVTSTEVLKPDGAAAGAAGVTGKKAFVDFQNDVTSRDLALAMREGFRSIEHVKRYTTTGMATDQGKTSSLNALGIVAGRLGKAVPDVGHTTYRMPYTPVSFGTLAGPARGARDREQDLPDVVDGERGQCLGHGGVQRRELPGGHRLDDGGAGRAGRTDQHHGSGSEPWRVEDSCEDRRRLRRGDAGLRQVDHHGVGFARQVGVAHVDEDGGVRAGRCREAEDGSDQEVAGDLECASHHLRPWASRASAPSAAPRSTPSPS